LNKDIKYNIKLFAFIQRQTKHLYTTQYIHIIKEKYRKSFKILDIHSRTTPENDCLKCESAYTVIFLLGRLMPLSTIF
jgi:hypothetical protein